MGTIVKRERQTGGFAYLARIRIKRDNRIVHRESRTFETHRRAEAWIKERETELAKPGVIDRVAMQDITLSQAIDRYIDESQRKIGKTKAQVLAALKTYPIAALPCQSVTSPEIVTLAQTLSKDRQPQTVGNYLSHLAAVFALAEPAWGYPLDRQAMADAATVARKLGLTSKSKSRDRRPSLDELDRLLAHFEQRRRPSLPMARVTLFALFSTRRQEEITRLLWADLDGDRILVRDMKHPGEKIGNDVWCDLPAPALAMIHAMPKVEPEIFPFTGDAISAAFTRACQFLAIDDLHFHDLRHEGVSRLFEMGLNIPHVAAVSGHRSWSSLKRYTHLRASGDKYKDWPWIDRLSQPMPHKPLRDPYAERRAAHRPPPRPAQTRQAG